MSTTPEQKLQRAKDFMQKIIDMKPQVFLQEYDGLEQPYTIKQTIDVSVLEQIQEEAWHLLVDISE